MSESHLPHPESQMDSSIDVELIVDWVNDQATKHSEARLALEFEEEADPFPSDPIVAALRERRIGELQGQANTLVGLRDLLKAATGLTDDAIERLLS